ncbi:hypothetical protein ACUXAV_000339 [Cupriavidus metallidurans]|uniref:DUF1064 domain-containing protein n=1 Tax=Cupriavidus metallidurans TaxID=119219 RepID=UPI000A86AB29|nr:DUF1064 domain-containing protein [Cupriavidus metallidurans]MDE4918300.1 DUF1064 domain-containing protein [Cupriavidus metallidurans]
MSKMLRWSAEQLAAHQARVPKPAPAAPSKADRAAAVLKRNQAKGRLPRGTMNKTEARYGIYLDQQKLAGAVLWWNFEGIKLMLAKNTSITIDFAVMSASGVLEMHDVKGAKAMIEDDARAKTKVAAALYPFVFKFVYPAGKGSDGWIEEEI